MAHRHTFGRFQAKSLISLIYLTRAWLLVEDVLEVARSCVCERSFLRHWNTVHRLGRVLLSLECIVSGEVNLAVISVKVRNPASSLKLLAFKMLPMWDLIGLVNLNVNLCLVRVSSNKAYDFQNFAVVIGSDWHCSLTTSGLFIWLLTVDLPFNIILNPCLVLGLDLADPHSLSLNLVLGFFSQILVCFKSHITTLTFFHQSLRFRFFGFFLLLLVQATCHCAALDRPL